MSHQSRLTFSLVAKDPHSGARAGILSTTRGSVETPVFMPVATHGALRGVDLEDAASMGYRVLLANTYHLLLRPGPELMTQFGGLHRFMRWPHFLLTDSGGYQIFSLARHLTMSEEGAVFRSYIDGALIALTPERSIEVQKALGSDIMMVLDHCIDSTSPEREAREALSLTARWARRSYLARGEECLQALFGIVQGACSLALRRESAEQILAIPFDGYALGGLAVGESKSEREDVVEFAAPLLPENAPRYLMGVGTPIDLLEAVKRGMDMFDCILPTSLAHQGVCFTSRGKVDLRRGVYRDDQNPLDAECGCATCARFTRAYLSHLIRAKEFIVGHHLSIHNLTFYHSLMSRMRSAIIEGTFNALYRRERESLARIDEENPSIPPRRRECEGPSLQLGNYEVVVHKDGYGSIRQRSSGETMHSVTEPIVEAHALYVAQTGILDTMPLSEEPLVIWDVGLGAAANAMALIHAWENTERKRFKINLVSFENDLDSLRLASNHHALFRYLRHSAPHKLLENGSWQSEDGSLSWCLLEGDFLTRLPSAPSPRIVWFDPFSYKTDSNLWTRDTFQRILSQCGDRQTHLYTYTTSTAVRAAMLAAGWYVGPGRGSGPKEETTIGYSPRAAAATPGVRLLNSNWLERWRRSDAKFPCGETASDLLELIEKHPQFCPE